jgi:hypothetical protein
VNGICSCAQKSKHTIPRMVQCYCVKCKAKRNIKGEPVHKKTKKGTPMIQGPCEKCGTKMTMFGTGSKSTGSKTKSKKK